jgi:phosphate transport system protein
MKASNDENDMIFIDIFQLTATLENSIVLLGEMSKALDLDDSSLVQVVFANDKKPIKIIKVAEKLIKKNPDKLKLILKLMATARRLERVSDLIENVAEEIVYYVEAKVLKHKKKKEKLDPKV